MFRRVRLAGAAILLLLASASVSVAQQTDSTSTPRTGSRPGRGSIGAQLGGAWILSDQDYSDGAQPRFSFTGSYAYVISPRWRWQVNPWFMWNSYRTGVAIPFVDPNFPTETTKDFFLTQMVGGQGLIELTGGKGTWIWHVGAGPAIYRVMVEDHRKVLKDPTTKRLHRGAYIGGTAELGIERFLHSLPNTSLEWTVAWHVADAKRDDQFPNGFSGRPHMAEFRFGSHYYFDFKGGKKTAAAPRPRR